MEVKCQVKHCNRAIVGLKKQNKNIARGEGFKELHLKENKSQIYKK